MKKCLLLMISVLVSYMSFAQDSQESQIVIKAGVGGIFKMDLGGGVLFADGSSKYPVNMGGGGFAFFDVRYLELLLAYTMGDSMFAEKNNRGKVTYNSPGSFSTINIGLLLKLPFEAGPAQIYPLAGIDYQIFLSRTGKLLGVGVDDSPDIELSDLNSLWFDFGFGVDFGISESFFIRVEALYGLRLINKYDEYIVDSAPVSDSTGLIQVAHGPTFKLAAGFSFE
ncbi:MAG: hypothetical protein LBC27_09430 [Spirochaetaceae bacterium]|jgi:hypothetical protein|nr:hypothetical protein [Spirochaetaceae bacterium]